MSHGLKVVYEEGLCTLDLGCGEPALGVQVLRVSSL